MGTRKRRGTIEPVSLPGEPERWRVTVSLGRDPETGRYGRKKRIVEGTREQAEAVRDRLHEAYDHKGLPEVDRDAPPSCSPPAPEADLGLVLAGGDLRRSGPPALCAAPAPLGAGVGLAAGPVEAKAVPAFDAADGDGGGPTFAQLVEIHVARKKGFGKWAASTEYSYRQYIERNAVPAFGPVPLGAIDTLAVERLYLLLMDAYLREKGKSAASLVNELHRHLKSTFATAVHLGLMPANPCDGAERPAYRKPEQSTLGIQEARRLVALLDGMCGRDIAAAVRLALCAGLRAEEVAGLEWRAVDLRGGRLAVVKAATRFEEKGPKSESGKRIVALDSATAAWLARFRAEQAARLRCLGMDQTDRTHVVLTQKGAAMGYEALKSAWARFRRKNEVRNAEGGLATFHQLRHTYASLLLSGGAPLPAVSKVLGHGDANVTARIYAHALPGQERELADLFGDLVA